MFLCVALALVMIGCRSKSKEGSSEVKTDLGILGNSYVARRFESYKERRDSMEAGCVASTENRRVIVTGFGLFTGVTSNISGAITNSMSSLEFFSDLSGMSEIKSSSRMHTPGKIAEAEYGARSNVRILSLKGEKFEVCFLTLDVIWDLAAAIIIDEARRFKPDLIIMSGLNGADRYGLTLEGGAINKAIKSGAYGANGKLLTIMPRKEYILKGDSIPSTLAMTWDNKKLAGSIEREVEGIDKSYVIRSPAAARSSNNYICNNVSFAVLASLAGHPVDLAGSMISFPALTQKAKAGFLHYPANSRNIDYEINEWSKVLGLIISKHFE